GCRNDDCLANPLGLNRFAVGIARADIITPIQRQVACIMAQPLIPLVDTHQHLVYADRFPYSWTDGIPALAGRSFTYDVYVRMIESLAVAAAVFMETAPDDPHWLEETQHVARLAATPESLIASMIANGRPEEEGFEAYLDSLDALPVVG